MIKKDFNAVYRSINNISLRQFPTKTLQKMYENYSVNQQKLFDEIKKIKKTQKEKLDTHGGLEQVVSLIFIIQSQVQVESLR